MRFKLDENLDPRLVELFRTGGHDVETVKDERLSGVSDDKLFRVAIAEERTLVTLDLDFSNPLRYPTKGSAGVIVIRVARPLLQLIETAVTGALTRIKEGQVLGRLWIVEPGRIREYTPDTDE